MFILFYARLDYSILVNPGVTYSASLHPACDARSETECFAPGVTSIDYSSTQQSKVAQYMSGLVFINQNNIYIPSRGGPAISSRAFFVTSHCRHILSSGHSFFLAICCIIAVKNDCGLKKPANQTAAGSWKSDVQVSSSFTRSRRSAYQALRTARDGYAFLAQDAGTVSKNSELPSSSMSDVIVSSP